MATTIPTSISLRTQHYTKSGQLDKRYSLRGTVDKKALRAEIRREFFRLLEDGGIEAPDPASEKETANEKANKVGKSWKTSVYAVSILTRSSVSVGSRFANEYWSTDKVKLAQTVVDGTSSTVISAIGLAGPYGALVASVLSTVKFVFGSKISNVIQRSGDKKRYKYSLRNLDVNRFGTYAYNSSSDEWVAQDSIKAQKRILGKKYIS